MMKKAKVSLLSISDCTEKNGVVTFINAFAALGDEFAARGLEITNICFRDAKPAHDKQRSAVAVPLTGIPTTRAPAASRTASVKARAKAWLQGGPTRAFVHFLFTLAARGAIVYFKAALRGRPEIYFHQDFFTAFFAALFGRRRARNVLVLHSGSDPLRHLFIWFRPLVGTVYESWIRKAFDYTMRNQDAVIGLSQTLVDETSRKYRIPLLRCIYNTSLELPRDGAYQRRPDCMNLVAVGSLQFVKGYDLLVEAIAGLSHAYREKIRVVIVGDGPERGSLQEQVRTHGLDEQVVLVGNTDNVGFYLNGADAFILSSRDEGLPIALIEAMQASLPLIVTRVGTIPEIVDGQSAVFIDAAVPSIQHALVEILDGNYDLALLSAASRQVYTSKLSPAAFIEQYSDVLMHVHRR